MLADDANVHYIPDIEAIACVHLKRINLI